MNAYFLAVSDPEFLGGEPVFRAVRVCRCT